MIGIVCAMEKEAQTILEHMDIQVKYTSFGKRFYVGLVTNKRCVLGISGVGKVNAAMTTQYLLDTYKEISVILNIGVCGGVKGKIELGNIYTVSEAAQYDFDTSEIDDVPPGHIYDIEKVFIDLKSRYSDKLSKFFPYARLATGDRFTSSEEISSFIQKHFGAELREMEGGAIAQVCAFHQKDCIMLKGISDYVGKDSVDMYKTYSDKALETFSRSVPIIFEALCN